MSRPTSAGYYGARKKRVTARFVRSQTMAKHTPVHYPARPPDSPSLGSSPRGAAVYDSHSTATHECTVVSLPPASALGAAEGTPLSAGRSLTGRGSNHRLLRDRPALVCLAAERDLTHLLCPVRTLACYVKSTEALRKFQQLFVHYRKHSQGLPLTKQRLSHWLCDAITQAYGSKWRL